MMVCKNKRSIMILFILILTLIGIFIKNELAKDERSDALLKKEDGTEQLVYETKLMSLDKSEISLENYKNKVLVLNFWTSWCSYCINEVPELNDFHKKQPENVEFLAINMTADEKNAKSAEKFKQQYESKFPIFLDETGHLQKSFEINSFPTTFIIDSSGVVRYKIKGEVTQQQLSKIVSKL